MSTVVVPAATRPIAAAEAAPEMAPPAEAGGGVACRVQHLPCRVEHHGPAAVDTFFTPLVREAAPGVLEGQFRGRPLDGSTVRLPADYEGLVTRLDHEEDGTTFTATERFAEFTSWNWDLAPSASDPVVRLQDWLDLAHAVMLLTDVVVRQVHATSDDN